MPGHVRCAGQRCVVIDPEDIDGDRLRTANERRPEHIDGDIVGAVACAVDTTLPVAAAKTPPIEVQRTAGNAVVLAEATTHRNAGAGAQVNHDIASKRQHTLARRQIDDGAVGGIDDLAVTVDAQAGAMGIEHAVDREIAHCGETDRADLVAAGIDGAVDGQIPAIQRDLDIAGLDLVADDQIALLDLESARTEHAAGVEANVQSREVGKRLRAHSEFGRIVRHHRATGVIIARCAAPDRSGESDVASTLVQSRRGKRAAAIVLRRQVDHRSRRLRDVTGIAGENEIAAPAIFGDVEHLHRAAGQIEVRTVAEHDVASCRQDKLARRQHDTGIDREGVTCQLELGAERVDLRHCRAIRSGNDNIAAGGDRVDRPRPAGEQRRRECQITAGVLIAGPGIVIALPMMDAERALAVRGDALAGGNADIGEAKRETIVCYGAARPGIRRGAEHDTLRRDVEPAVAKEAGHRCAGRCLRTGPDELARADRRHIARSAIAVDCGRAEHQPPDLRCVEGHAAKNVHAVARIEHQGFERRGAGRGIACEQLREQALIER